MTHQATRATPTRAQRLADQALATLERFLHVEAISGVVLLLAAAAALVWANSSVGAAYQALWHQPVSIAFGEWAVRQPLHFWVNDGLMTLFFGVVGLEIRREMHEGALASVQQAALPLVAAIGGVVMPALIYVNLHAGGPASSGWAVPTATDIAFAVGVLALLGRHIHANVRVLLLALAIIDDIVAVLIIAIFYSASLNPVGALISAAALAMVWGLRALGIRRALAYLLPGLLLWLGLLKTGIHPTLAGVVLGLMTPMTLLKAHESEPPAVRLQSVLHPWVAFGVMPLFALANAGVTVDANVLGSTHVLPVAGAVALALVLGKPLGVVVACWLGVRLGLCKLPEGVSWSGVVLVGLLAGIGFTMAIFIAGLAFADEALLDAAKLGVLAGSAAAAVLGLTYGVLFARQRKNPS